MAPDSFGMTDRRTGDVGAPRWVTFALLAVVAGVVAAQAATLGPMAIDDAYISFRYAANFAHGEGLVFNPGERVQGFTNPLFTLLLGVAGAVGLDIPTAAFILGIAGAFATVTGVVLFAPGIRWRIVACIGAIGLVLTPEFFLNAVSGMETSIFCAILVAVLVTFDRGRARLLGVLLGLLIITRPDGAFWAVPLGVYLLVRDRRALVRTVVPALVIAGAWWLFAWIYYGNPVPHSIAAKRLIHPGSFGPVLLRHVRFLASGELIGLALVASLGLVLEVIRRSRMVVVAAAAMLSLLGLVASGVMPFEVPRYFLWYSVPILPVALLFAVRAADETARRIGQSRLAVPAMFAVILVPTVLAARSSFQLHFEELPEIRAHFALREAAYQETAAAIRERTGDEPADVLVGEVGVLGYWLLGHRVHDSSGINSPAIHRLRKEDRRALEAEGLLVGGAVEEGSPRWVLEFLREERPEYVTTLRRFLHLGAIEEMPVFRENYEPIDQDRVWKGSGTLQNTLYARRLPEAAGR